MIFHFRVGWLGPGTRWNGKHTSCYCWYRYAIGPGKGELLVIGSELKAFFYSFLSKQMTELDTKHVYYTKKKTVFIIIFGCLLHKKYFILPSRNAQCRGPHPQRYYLRVRKVLSLRCYIWLCNHLSSWIYKAKMFTFAFAYLWYVPLYSSFI